MSAFARKFCLAILSAALGGKVPEQLAGIVEKATGGAGYAEAGAFARDLEATVGWYRRHLGGEVMFDGDFGGARNVFMTVGSGRLNFPT